MGCMLFLCLSAVIFMLILHPEKYIKSVYNGMLLFAVNVLPALFPFFFLTKLLTSLSAVDSITKFMQKPVKKIFKLPPQCSFIFFMSILSGYPVGAKLISEFYVKGGAGRKNLTRTAAVCSTSGPLFIMGTVGFTMFGSRAAGFMIYAAHILSVLLFALASGLFVKDKDIKDSGIIFSHDINRDNILSESIYSSVMSIMAAGGFISIFYMLIDMLAGSFAAGFAENILSKVFELLSLPPCLAKGFLNGIIEITRGCLDISNTSAPLCFKLPFCAFLITFSGACIMMQSFAFLGKCKINYVKFIIYKFIQAVTAALLCAVFSAAFNI